MLFAAFLHLGPQRLTIGLNNVMMNAAGRSLRLIDDVRNSLSIMARVVPQTQAESLDDSEAVQELRRQNRDLVAMLTLLQDENKKLNSIPDVLKSEETPALEATTALPAQVIGRQGDRLSDRQRQIVSVGARHGLVGEELILEGTGIVIDHGSNSKIGEDQLVTFGRSLFGRTTSIGPWTSLVQSVADPEFRTAVRLIRPSEFGTVMGARGILKGTGTGCEMIEVVGTEPVAVGDLVYTDPVASPTNVPIYCGRVTHADIEPSAPHWTIQVMPPTSPDHLPSQLLVLRTELQLNESTASPR